MIEPNNFQSEKDHEKITKLEEPEVNSRKAVAFLHLGYYSEALKFCIKGSFEAAYAYYKLWDVLKSQILYGMGYFNKAYELLNKLPKDDEIVVILQAMKCLGILIEKVNKVVGHKLYLKKKEEEMMYDNFDNYFTDTETNIEYLFNKTFECADKKSEYLGTLKKVFEQFNNKLESNIFKKQMLNIEGYFDELDIDTLSKTQKNILNYNMKKTDIIENGLHFLANYQSDLSDNEYKWIEHIKKKKLERKLE